MTNPYKNGIIKGKYANLREKIHGGRKNENT